MCNRYDSPSLTDISHYWKIDASSIAEWSGGNVFPRSQGPFVRANTAGTLELVIGQWGLIPCFSRTAHVAYATNNARAEELTDKASYRQPWLRRQRCLIPAWSFDEPCWETGRNIWWTFHRADKTPWGLAGLWNTWTDPATGQILESYTMLTINADAHPLMRRMHKPDPTLGPDQQDKRSVIAIEPEYVELWLSGSAAKVHSLLQAPAMQTIHGQALSTPPLREIQPSLF